jgi:hypothetical protein
MDPIGLSGSSSATFRPSLRHGTVGPSGNCRCGTKLGASTPRYFINGAPGSITAIVSGHPFCSELCVRAFFLESMETLDALDAPGSERTVSDLHTVYFAIVQTFAEVLRMPPSAAP